MDTSFGFNDQKRHRLSRDVDEGKPLPGTEPASTANEYSAAAAEEEEEVEVNVSTRAMRAVTCLSRSPPLIDTSVTCCSGAC